MRRSLLLAMFAFVAAVAAPCPSVAGDVGRVRGTIVLERGRLPVPLARAVVVVATDLSGNPVGRVRYRATPGALRYEITGLPLGGTLFVELMLRRGFRDAEAAFVVPTLARSDRSSPIYAFALERTAPVEAPLDFRVVVIRDPTPSSVSLRSGTLATR